MTGVDFNLPVPTAKIQSCKPLGIRKCVKEIINSRKRKRILFSDVIQSAIVYAETEEPSFFLKNTNGEAHGNVKAQ